MRPAKLSRCVPKRVRPWLANRMPLSGEVRRGACLGCVGCVAATAVAGAALPALPIALVGGGAAGALIGLLLWCGSSDEHQDLVVPPR